MKKFFVLAVLFLSFKSWGQDSVKLKPAMVEQYCQIIAYQTSLFSPKVNIEIDYGQEAKRQKDLLLKDSANANKIFNTVVDALNYIGKQGWLVVNVYNTASRGSTDNTVYVFKKNG